jgi:molecular chaperone DnaK (HSP70)
MSDDEGFGRVAIGISFGNSNSSIARVDSVSPTRPHNLF